MCIIAYKPKGVGIFDMDIIESCFYNNPDGAGFMWVENEQVYIRKGFFEFRDLGKELEKLKRKIDIETTPLVIHCRIATHGKIAPGYCHPFPVANKVSILKRKSIKCNMALAHNGTINGFGSHIDSYSFYNRKTKKQMLSDTMDFVKTVVYPTKELLYTPKHSLILNMYQKIVGESRLIILDKDSQVWMLGKWEDYRGWYFSNGSYLDYTSSCYSECDFCGKQTEKLYLYNGYLICKNCLKSIEEEYI